MFSQNSLSLANPIRVQITRKEKSLPIATISISPIYHKKMKIYKKWFRKLKKNQPPIIPTTWNTIKTFLNYFLSSPARFNEDGEKFLYTF
jgi:hypothetical protein